MPVDPRTFSDPVIRKGWIEEKGMKVFQMRALNDPMRSVDIFVESPIEFEELWNRSETVMVGETPIRIASIGDIIALKRKVGRPKDMADISDLEEIMSLQNGADDETN